VEKEIEIAFDVEVEAVAARASAGVDILSAVGRAVTIPEVRRAMDSRSALARAPYSNSFTMYWRSNSAE